MPAALYGETPSSQSTPLWRTQLLYKLRIDLSPPVSSAQHSPQAFIVYPGTSSDGNTTVNRSRFRCAWSFVREAESWHMCIVCSACFEVSWTREWAPGKCLIATCCSWIVQHPPLFLRNITCDTFPRSFVMPLQTATALHATSSSRVIRLSVLSMSLLMKKPRARGFASSLTTHHPSLGGKTKNLIVRASWDKSTLWIQQTCSWSTRNFPLWSAQTIWSNPTTPKNHVNDLENELSHLLFQVNITRLSWRCGGDHTGQHCQLPFCWRAGGPQSLIMPAVSSLVILRPSQRSCFPPIRAR